ncbi:MAG: RecQ family ATP-dependent DNA helicase [Bacteroidota bacterium]
MPNPQCPTCGSSTQLRTARRGRNAGQQFYGCSRYPTCRGVVNIQGGQTETTVDATPVASSARLSLPRIFVCRQRFERLQVRFFQSVAVSASVLESLIDDGVSDQTKRAFAQWRLDFPTPSQPPNWTERQRQMFSIAEKILTRGRLTLCSPSVESTFTKKFIGAEPQSIKISDEMLTQTIQHINTDYWLDSPPEKLFYKDYLPDKFGIAFLQWVTPQVELTSLLSTNAAPQFSGRVDFLICHPANQPIVIEIDGEHHRQQQELDNLRDEALSKEGFRVIRIPASELETFSGPNLTALEESFAVQASEPDETMLHNQGLLECIYAIKLSHQIQLSALQAIQIGNLQIVDSSSWNISTDLNASGWLNDNDSLFVLKTALDDLIQLLRHLGQLYSIEVCKGNPKLSLGSGSSGIHLSFTGEVHPFLPTFFLQNISAPFDIANAVFTSSSAILDSPTATTLEYFLNYVFRKATFWEGQFDAVSRTLQGKDSIVLLPTGAGKSIAFQLASFLLPGQALVIDPIISLMEDQIDNLQMVGIDRAIAISSQITDPQDRSKVLSLFGQGEYLFAYIAPERFQTVEFREALRTLTTHTPISLIAVDEAHCVSEWGHDFRTAYLNIGRTSRAYCESNGIAPPLLALTGTASRAVLKDVQRELQIEEFDAIITPKSFDRPELKFHILTSSSAEKSARLLGYLGHTLPSNFATTSASFFQPNGRSTFSGLVFCPHVNGDFGIVSQADNIRRSLSVPTGLYAGQKPKHWDGTDWDAHKRAMAKQFKHNHLSMLVCTKAFGMGIDKPNIRFTVHFGIPPSIESFYQEAGRAGRDRKPAQCCVIVSDDDPVRSRRLLDPNTKPEDVFSTVKNLAWDDNDDVTRALFFQTNAFPGTDVEKSRVVQIIRSLPDLSTRSTRSIKFPDLERGDAEKALHRLVVLGIVSDYTINYNTQEFSVKLAGATKESVMETYGKYVAGYLGARRQAEIEKATKLFHLSLGDFVLGMVDLLLHFIYDVIERGRRRALYEMFLAATESPNDAAIRQRILRYLEATQYSEALEAILAESDAGLEKTMETFEAVRSPNEAAELRGQVARYLESYPDHPGLLMLRSLAEAHSRDRNTTIVKQNFSASISSASQNYAVERNDLFEFIAWAIVKVGTRNLPLAQDLQVDMLREYPERPFARTLVGQSPIEIASTPAWFLLNGLTKRSKELISS